MRTYHKFTAIANLHNVVVDVLEANNFYTEEDRVFDDVNGTPHCDNAELAHESESMDEYEADTLHGIYLEDNCVLINKLQHLFA